MRVRVEFVLEVDEDDYRRSVGGPVTILGMTQEIREQAVDAILDNMLMEGIKVRKVEK